MRTQEWSRNRGEAVHFPQLTDFKPVLRQHCLTLFKTGTYTGFMTNRRLPAAVLVLAFLGAAPWLHAQATRRALYVSALDKTGAPVSDLAPQDIAVREDNVAREVLTVAPAVEPMQVALLVDNSQAASPFIRDYREALAAFVDALTNGEQPGTRNEVAIITIAERPTIATEYTTDRGALIKGAQRIFSSTNSGTYLLDGIVETSQGITKRRSPRPVIVALLTEGPELSDRFYQQVLTTLRASGAALHVITVGRPRNDAHDRSVVISEGPRSTGGNYDALLTSTALTGRLKRLAAELTHQFRVTYSRPQSLIPPERVTVSAARPGLTVRGTPAVADREQERP
jgi:hypothetical protein